MKSLFIHALFLVLPFAVFSQGANTHHFSKPKLDTVTYKDPAHPAVTVFKVTDSTGAIIEYGELVNEKKEGLWRTYFDNHIIYTLDEYHNGKKNGYSQMHASDGRLLKEENYADDVLNGPVRHFSRDSKIKSEETYVNGVVVGRHRIYYPDGALQEDGNTNDKGLRDGVNKWYYNNGKLLVEYIYTNGDINGPTKSFYENGKLKAEGMMKDNYESGHWKEYSDSGLIKSEGDYVAGKKSGVWKQYNQEGILDKTQTWKDGTMLDEKIVKKK